jgi:signal transduction histidine kinase
MNNFLLSTFSLMALIIIVTAILFIFSLKYFAGKADYKQWLFLYFISLLVWHGTGFISGGLHSELREISYRYTNTLFNFGFCLTNIAFIQVAYMFPQTVFKKERKGVLFVTLAVSIIYLSAIIWFHFIGSQEGHSSYTYGKFVNPLAGSMGLLSTFWAMLVFVRMSIYFKKQKSRNAIPAQILSISTGTTIIISSLFIYPGVGNPMVMLIYTYGVWLVIQVQVLVFMIYSVFPIQFQTKLVGFTFASVMSILSVATMVLVPFTDNSNNPVNLAQRLNDQEILFRLMLIILGSATFILVVFPVILRVSLVRPLERLLVGIQKADQGDLSVEVPHGMLDEIGIVTRNFNNMVKSLKQSKDDLIQYANTLENKVSERTSQLKMSLDNLKKTQEQLIQQEKLASLGELTAGIAHEIQNPLNFVNNFSELSKELMKEFNEELDKNNIEEAKELAADIELNLSKIHHHGERASSIVKGMLEHSRTRTGEKELSDINELVDECLRLSYHGFRAKDKTFKAQLVTKLDEKLPAVEVIRNDIGRVLLNLINNAFHAVRNVENPKIVVSTKNLGDKIEIQVKDNGHGIPDDIKDKIFQPFFTTKAAGEGTGLGLSLSYDIVTKGHRGTIELNTKPGEGSEFTIRLPRANRT